MSRTKLSEAGDQEKREEGTATARGTHTRAGGDRRNNNEVPQTLMGEEEMPLTADNQHSAEGARK